MSLPMIFGKLGRVCRENRLGRKSRHRTFFLAAVCDVLSTLSVFPALEGDRLRVCIMVDPQHITERPTEFALKGASSVAWPRFAVKSWAIRIACRAAGGPSPVRHPTGH